MLNQDATEDLNEIVDRVTAAVDNPEEADESVAFVDEPEKADRTVVKPDGSDNDDETDSNESSEAECASEESPDVGLVESDHETALTETLDGSRVRTPERKIRMGTTKVDRDVADEFGSTLRSRGATVEDHSITAPLSAYNNQVRESTEIPSMSVISETEQEFPWWCARIRFLGDRGLVNIEPDGNRWQRKRAVGVNDLPEEGCLLPVRHVALVFEPHCEERG